MAKTYKSTRKSYPVNPPEDNYQVEDAFVPISAPIPNPLNFISNLLGLAPSLQTDIQFIEASRKGIKKSALDKLTSKLGITQEKMCKLLHMSTRTYQRLKADEALDVFTSEQAIEMAQVLEKAQAVFDSDITVKQWLQTPSLALGGVAPLDFLDTRFGSKMVLNTLGRIEHGVYA